MTDGSDRPYHRTVYQPAEDSTLLLETAAELIDPAWTVIETGVGSGFVASKLHEQTGAHVIGTDINPYACRASIELGIDCIRCSLIDAIADASADAVIFNPPYLPDEEHLPDDWLSAAVSGGPTGAEVALAWLTDLGRVLRADGIGILIVSSHTGIDRMISAARQQGFEPTVHSRQRWSFEQLVSIVLRRG